ncbi:MAG: type II CRISPR RNA-guided endonuclease Cas9 [Rikenellaceae bacterium]
MRQILGLDLGVGSIGWAIIKEAENESEESDIIRMGAKICSLTTEEIKNFESGKSITINGERTAARSARRNLQRYKLRRAELISILKNEKIIEETQNLLEEGNFSTFETYRLRAKAAREMISLSEFARVLLMINKKRGYKSSRKVKGGEDGALINEISIAEKLYNENLTPAQYVCHEVFDKGKSYIPAFYASDLKAELNKIWEYQTLFYPEILTVQLKEKITGKSSKQVAKIFLADKGVFLSENKGKERKRIEFRLRNDALHQQIEIEQIATIISSLSGEIGNASGYLGAISDNSKILITSKLTIGEYLMSQLEQFPNKSLKNVIFYRQDYLNEFETIWEEQAKYHKELTPKLKSEIRDVVIFYQRALKSQKGLLSYCEFESEEIKVKVDGKLKRKRKGLKVAPKSSPIFQEFKVWQVINNLKITDKETNKIIEISDEDKAKIYKVLVFHDKIKGTDIIKLLFGKPKLYDINFKEVEGNRTLAAFFKACCDIITVNGMDPSAISALNSDDALKNIDKIFEVLGINSDILRFDSQLQGVELEKQLSFKLWHLLYSFEEEVSKRGIEPLVEKIQSLCSCGETEAKILASISLQDDYGSLCSKAMRKILPFLHAGHEYSEACNFAGYRHSKKSLTVEEIKEKVLVDKLENLPKNSLRNPVVEKVLNQMINVVNECSAKYGKPDEIRIELARELKNSAADRKSISEGIASATKENERLKEVIKKKFGFTHVSRTDIVRYKLYLELEPNGFKTLYSDSYIPEDKIFDDTFEIEHIIPRSRLFDDSFSNKTLETHNANQDKGSETALDFVARRYGDEELERYKIKVSSLPLSNAKKKKLLMRGEEIPDGFINRDLKDTQYIAKKAKEILESYVRYVVSTTGSITDKLRQDWQLIDVMQELSWDKYDILALTSVTKDRKGNTVRHIENWTKRSDHRHHAMDALTVAFTKLSFINYLNRMNSIGEKPKDVKGRNVFAPPIPLDEFRAKAKHHLEMILISIQSRSKVTTTNKNRTKTRSGKKYNVQDTLTPRGSLHNETIYGRIVRPVPSIMKINGKTTYEQIERVTKPQYRTLLKERLDKFGGDSKKAFAGKNSLAKNPIWLDDNQTMAMEDSVKIVTFNEIFTIRKPVTKDLNIEKVIDNKLRNLLLARLAEFGGDKDKAFSNLEDNPIWIDEAKGVKLSRVTIEGVSTTTPLHSKRDMYGEKILDSNGNTIPNDYVSTSGNHHVAIFVDADGNLQEHCVSFFETVALKSQGYDVIDREYRSEDDWKFLFTMKRNEYFVFPNTVSGFDPNTVSGFDPNTIDLTNPENCSIISPNLYRVQKLATKNYCFRHHLETTVDDTKVLRDITWKRIQTVNNLKGAVKVRVNSIGDIVEVGEY